MDIIAHAGSSLMASKHSDKKSRSKSLPEAGTIVGSGSSKGHNELLCGTGGGVMWKLGKKQLY